MPFIFNVCSLAKRLLVFLEIDERNGTEEKVRNDDSTRGKLTLPLSTSSGETLIFVAARKLLRVNGQTRVSRKPDIRL